MSLRSSAPLSDRNQHLEASSWVKLQSRTHQRAGKLTRKPLYLCAGPVQTQQEPAVNKRTVTIVEKSPTICTIHGPQGSNQRINELSTKSAAASLSSLFLPVGYPHTVSPDYLPYQLWTVPAHITGWLGHALVTSSMLKAVGISAGAVGATAATATIKWITKDGVGAAGRLVVGGRLGLEFDDDPRRWRMIAEVISSVGLALEIATAIFPGSFVLLAGVGNLTKAVGKGLGKPVFRVIQTHFALVGNVGAVAAKEEVWEVTGQLMGYAASLVMLEALEKNGMTWQSVVSIWAFMQAVHVMFRFQALSTLRFRYLNQKRACAAALAYLETGTVPSIEYLNKTEPMLADAGDLQPRVHFGCSLEEAWGGTPPYDQLIQVFQEYEHEKYVLIWREGEAYVLVKETYDSACLMRAIWQAAWLQRHCAGQRSNTHDIHQSLQALNRDYGGFLEALKSNGWNMEVGASFKLGPVRVSADHIQ